MIRTLIVGGIRFYRDGLALYLARHPGVMCAGTATSRVEALERVRELRPDVVLLDVALPESLALAHDVAERAPDVRVIALAMPDADGFMIACAEAGIAGFVPCDASLDDLMNAIEDATHGEVHLSPAAGANLIRYVAALAKGRVRSTGGVALTKREMEIVHLIEGGLSNKEIAHHLRIQLATVKNHVHHILEKLRIHRRSEITRELGRGSYIRRADEATTSRVSHRPGN